MCVLCAFICRLIECHKNRKRNILKVKYDGVGLLQKEELCGVTGKGPPPSHICLPFFPVVVIGLSCFLFMVT